MKIVLKQNPSTMSEADMKNAVQTLRQLKQRFDQLSMMELENKISYDQACEQLLYTVDELLANYEV